jgi:hypothetical protein
MEDMEDGVEKEREPSLGEGTRPVGGSGSDNVPSDAADSMGKGGGEGPALLAEEAARDDWMREEEGRWGLTSSGGGY